MSIYATDVWRIGIIKAPMDQVISESIMDVHWLPAEHDYKFLADPFGLYKDGKLYIFAELYDYKDRHGRIELLILNDDLEILERKIVLEEPWHLSYPFLIEDKGEIYMMPEAYKSGKVTLYKAVDFPYQWEPVESFSFPETAIDPTVVFYNDLWWMFYTPVEAGLSRQGSLSVAWSKDLCGVWHKHVNNPVRITPFSSRPGGSALMTKDGIVLPTQNCTYTYGESLSFLQITTLTLDYFEAKVMGEMYPDSSFEEYKQGLHTLSSAGPYTLIDAKKIIKTPFQRLLIDGEYHFKKHLHKL